VSTKPSKRLLVPALRPAAREVLVAVAPFFLRDLMQAPAARPPLILSFATDGFMDDFLAVAGQTRTLPRLLPWRDWSEPPDAMLDTVGAKRYPNSIVRGPLLAFEPESGAGIDADGVPSGTPPWLRKLYLPLHERFNLIAFDVVCRSPGWPRLARSRVMESGAVIRRLVRHPTEEHWQDWIAVDDQHGAWIELLDGQMRPPDPPAASAEHQAVDPAALPVADLRMSAQAALHGLLDIPVGQALPPVALTSQPLALVPPDAGQAAEHCTLFGYLPVFSSAQEAVTARLSQRSVTTIAATLAAQTQSNLTALLAEAPGLRTRAAPHLRILLDDGLLPNRPSTTQAGNAWIAVIQYVYTPSAPVAPVPPPGNAAEVVAPVVDLVLREALRRLLARDGELAVVTAAVNGQVPRAQDFWTDALADQAALAPGLAGSIWLVHNRQHQPSAWDTLVRVRLHQVVDAWVAGTGIPAPAAGQGELLARDLAGLIALGVLRLRACRLALAAFLGRAVSWGLDNARFTAVDAQGDPVCTAAALGEEVSAILAAEDGRADPRTSPPWPPIVTAGLVDDARLLRVHRAGEAIGDIYATFDAILGEGGAAAARELIRRIDTVTGDIAAALNAGGARPLRSRALSLAEQPARALLILPGWGGAAAELAAFVSQAAARYPAAPDALALPEARARESAPRLRFDADHLYAVWCWVRVAGHHPFEPEQVIWTGRSEPFAIADPTDLLGGRPAVLKLPDIPKLLRDLPRLAKARARPFAAVTAPDRSGIVAGEEMADTQRDWGIGFICSFGIPVLTICAMVLFSLIFSILILIPGFTWMLLLKFCIPFPKKGS